MKMADEVRLTTALEGSIGRNDAGNEHARLEALRKRFERTRAILANGGAACLDQTENDVAFELMGVLAQMLRSGTADLLTLGMLADFLDSIKESEHIIARRVLGLEVSGGRTSSVLARARAIEVFRLWTSEGHSVDAGLVHAYNAYRASEPVRKEDKDVARRFGRYEVDSKRPSSDTTDTGVVIQSNEAAKFMESTIRPLLRAAGLLDSKPKGRPKKSRKN